MGRDSCGPWDVAYPSCYALEWGKGWKWRGVGGERPSFVNSEQNSRIKETGLKGSQSRWPWLQVGQAISCGPGRAALVPFLGLMGLLLGRVRQRPQNSPTHGCTGLGWGPL